MRILFMHTMFFFVIATTSYSQFKSYPSKEKTDYESIEIKLLPHKQGESFEAIALAAAPFLLEKTFSLIDTLKARKINKFTSSWDGQTNGDKLYLGFGNFNPPKIQITRYIKLSKSTKLIKAARIILSPKKSEDGRAFKYKVDTVDFKYSKAFIKDRFLDVSVDLDFTYYNEGENGYTKNELGTQSLVLKGVQIGNDTISFKNIESGWFPIPSYNAFEVFNSSFGLFSKNSEKGKQLLIDYAKGMNLCKEVFEDHSDQDNIDATIQKLNEHCPGITLDSIISRGWMPSPTEKDESKLTRIKHESGWYYSSQRSNTASGNYELKVVVNEANPSKANLQLRREKTAIAGQYIQDFVNKGIEIYKENEDDDDADKNGEESDSTE